ncbi:MAG: hypothetical protein QXZ13_02455 [Candidatus Diapherotrites archaeon]
MNFDLKEIADAIKNFPNFLVRILQLILIFVFGVILLVILLPAAIRTYFNYFPITENEYDSIAKFVLYSSVIFLIIYYATYLYKLIKFKKQRLESIALLHRKRYEKSLEILEKSNLEEGNKDCNKEGRGTNSNRVNNVNNVHESKENRIIEINSVIIPDEEICKKIIIETIQKNFDSDSQFFEKRVNDFLGFIMEKFGWDYKKAYYHIFIKKDVDFIL